MPTLTTAQAILLLFFLDSQRKLDPIRIMKGLFIFCMEVPEAWLPKHARYNFIAYSYGPYSRAIDSDLARLSLAGYLEQSKAPGRTWDYYSLSEKGIAKAREMATTLPPETLSYLHRIREFVLGLSFRKLLDTVYEKYPDYAVKSVFKH